MKIKIIKCSNSQWWYNKLINITVDVIEKKDEWGFFWLTPKEFKIYGVNHRESTGLGILCYDFIIYNRKEKLERILNETK